MITRALGVLTLIWCFSAVSARAQEADLVVLLSSAQDEVLADKLAELIRVPFQRVIAADLAANSETSAPPTAAASCRTHARLELSLDGVGHAVRLTRCSDATVLARGLDPEAARQSPYLAAFVAAELLSINRELEAVEARATVPAQADASTSAGPAPAAVSGGAVTPAEPDLSWALLLRAGAELTLWGAPFDRALRPSLGIGVALAPRALPVAFFVELGAGLFATAQETRAGGAEQLKLRRQELQLHAGVRLPAGPLVVSGFGLARASLTSAAYSADITTSSTHLRSGLGAGVAAEMPLSQSFAVYTQLTVDVATSRSDYRVAGVSWVRDPSSLFWIGLGLLARVSP